MIENHREGYELIKMFKAKSIKETQRNSYAAFF